jgi:hypothetical protein
VPRVAAWAVVVAILSGCGEETTDRFVGTVGGSDARFALVRSGDRAVGYVCGGPSSFMRLTRWFSGSIGEDGSFELTATEGMRLRGAVLGDAASGSVTLDAELTFTSTRATGGAIGLFDDGGSGECRTGVIVFEGSMIQGVGCDAGGRVAQVTPDGPVEASGFSVIAGSGDQARRVRVEPVSP